MKNQHTGELISARRKHKVCITIWYDSFLFSCFQRRTRSEKESREDYPVTSMAWSNVPKVSLAFHDQL